MSVSTGTAPSATLAGRLLAYADDDTYRVAAPLTRAHPLSGLVVRGQHASARIRSLRAAGHDQLLIDDVAAWTGIDATATAPMELPPDGGFFPVDIDHWAADHVAAGADLVLTPSRFVREEDWAALRSVLQCGATATRTDVVTLVATDAAMLDTSAIWHFLGILAEHHSRPLAFVFADSRPPFRIRGRVEGLRHLLSEHPGAVILSADIAIATDAMTHGALAAGIGMRGGLRRPQRPGDRGGGGAAGFIPGLFLRALWEQRSPRIYSDWYANRPSPTCEQCGGRALDTFTSSREDKALVLAHNVHAWLEVLTEITRRSPDGARAWLEGERRQALSAHAALRPVNACVEADAVLRYLCELDDPQHRETSPTGVWR